MNLSFICGDFCDQQWLAVLIVIACFIAVFEMVLKGFALWKSARNDHGVWFVCILVFNTAGILPIVYLLLNRTKKE